MMTEEKELELDRKITSLRKEVKSLTDAVYALTDLSTLDRAHNSRRLAYVSDVFFLFLEELILSDLHYDKEKLKKSIDERLEQNEKEKEKLNTTEMGKNIKNFIGELPSEWDD